MFADADRAYAYGRAGRAEYWGRLVEATHPAVRGLRAAANADLAADNGTGILVLAEDALLWPAVLEGKKKYAGLAATPRGAPPVRPRAEALREGARLHQDRADGLRPPDRGGPLVLSIVKALQ